MYWNHHHETIDAAPRGESSLVVGAADVARVASNETRGLSQEPSLSQPELRRITVGPESDRRGFGSGYDAERGRCAARMRRCPAACLVPGSAEAVRTDTAPSPLPCGCWFRRHSGPLHYCLLLSPKVFRQLSVFKTTGFLIRCTSGRQGHDVARPMYNATTSRSQ